MKNEDILTAAQQGWRKFNLTPSDKRWFNSDGVLCECCLIIAAVMYVTDCVEVFNEKEEGKVFRFEEYAAKVLGKHWLWVCAFIHGYDGNLKDWSLYNALRNTYDDGYLFGQKCRVDILNKSLPTISIKDSPKKQSAKSLYLDMGYRRRRA